MLNMSQINDIRDLSRKGYSISKISSLTGFDRKTVRKYLGKDDFSPEPPIAKTRTSIVTPYIDIITEWLEEDQKHWSKQRHTAKRIHERLVDEYGFSGSYDSVQKFVQKIRTNIQTRGTQELVWEPGSAQVDFGEADFNEDTDCVRRKYLTVSFPYSNDSFSQVFRGETAECAKVFGIDPKVAFLSFSTAGSAKDASVTKVQNATKKAQAKFPDIPIDGELQFDAAVSPRVGQQKKPGSNVAGYANTFIFPDINAGNIGYKIAQRMGQFEAYGPILLGLNAQINDLSRGCNAMEVYSMAIITAALA